MELNFSMYDIEYFFKKNQRIIFFLIVFLVLGLAVGIIITVTSDSYLSLLVSGDKTFFDYVNGKANFSKQTMRLIMSLLILNFIIFILNLNFYSGLFSFLIISYQSSLAFLSITAVISEYGFRGILISLLMILPINLINLLISMLMTCICFSRVCLTIKNKQRFYGLSDRRFWLVILILCLVCVVFACGVNIFLTLILRSRIFVIF